MPSRQYPKICRGCNTSLCTPPSITYDIYDSVIHSYDTHSSTALLISLSLRPYPTQLHIPPHAQASISPALPLLATIWLSD